MKIVMCEAGVCIYFPFIKQGGMKKETFEFTYSCWDQVGERNSHRSCSTKNLGLM